MRHPLLTPSHMISAFIEEGWCGIFELQEGKPLDRLDAQFRDDQARKAKADAKHQRRLERNKRIAGGN